MLVRGVEDTGGAGTGMSRKGGGGVRVTGWGWVRAGGAGPEVGLEGAVTGGRGAESSGREVGEGDEDISVLVVEVGRGACRVISKLIAMIESKEEK